MTGVVVSMPGKQIVKLPDGTTYIIDPPGANLEGLMTTTKRFIFTGELHITDEKNGLKAVVTYDANEPNRSGYLGGWIGGGHSNKEGEVSKDREDLIKCEIFKLPGESKDDIISTGTGSYLENI